MTTHPPSTPVSKIKEFLWQRFQQSFDNRRISQKISLGYGIALGVALGGTLAGLVVGDRLYHQAQETAHHSHEIGASLARLENLVLELQLNWQELLDLSKRPEAFKTKRFAILSEIRTEMQQIEQIKNNLAADHHQATIQETVEFQKVYRQKISPFLKSLNLIVGQIESPNFSASQLAITEKSLLKYYSRDSVLQLDELTNEVRYLVEDSFEKEEASEAQLAQAIRLRFWIVLGSMVLSLGLATLLAIYTSRAIAQPLDLATKVARRVTQEDNFRLQVPIASRDEIGELCQTLNSLIQRVDQLLAEQQAATQVQLMQSEKMSSLGRMVAGVAHEINNPVNFIYGNISHAQSYVEEMLELLALYAEKVPNPPSEVGDRIEEIDLEFLEEDLPKVLHSMQVGADRVRQIVLSLKDFSRLDEAKPHPVDLHACIDSSLLILNNRIKKICQVTRNYGDIPDLEGYSGLLYQVFVNLIVNALDALESLERGCSENEITITTQRLDAQNLQISIADNGPGIAEHDLAKIFEPFFTTKPRGIGTGLGLAISHQIITEKHGGTFTCRSQPGQGTQFIMTLPLQHPSNLTPIPLSGSAV